MTRKSVSMNPVAALALPPRLDGRILVIRDVRVMIDADLAALYGVPTRRLTMSRSSAMPTDSRPTSCSSSPRGRRPG